ncbi:MAG: indolepyruvate oxidoreductase subunit beta [Tissierellia bacterium]|nr:indolepyruvate oxidoreductase subunit beta [Tissierellia bacterium]
MKKSILFAGVGGQGILLASTILGAALMEAGYDVKMSEVIGMAQRGGSVTTQLRFGDKIDSPLISLGEADVLVSFELMEALRWSDYLRPGAKAIVNDYKLPSAPILTGDIKYPEGIREHLCNNFDCLLIDASNMAIELGNIRVQNIVLLGALAKALDLKEIDWHSYVEKYVKKEFQEINLKAFDLGYGL